MHQIPLYQQQMEVRLVMASAQQKPKKERGTRNSKRHNGKALKNDIAVIQMPAWFEQVDSDGKPTGKLLLDKVDSYSTARYGKDGNRITGKGRPRGKSYLGVSLKRLQAQADKLVNVSPDQDALEIVKAELLAKRERRNETRKMFGKAERSRQIEKERENAGRIVDARRRRDGLKSEVAA